MLLEQMLARDHAFDSYFPRKSSAYSLRDVNEVEFTQIHWTDDRLLHRSNLPGRVLALVRAMLSTPTSRADLTLPAASHDGQKFISFLCLIRHTLCDLLPVSLQQ